jgi:hypothetical protein
VSLDLMGCPPWRLHWGFTLACVGLLDSPLTWGGVWHDSRGIIPPWRHNTWFLELIWRGHPLLKGFVHDFEDVFTLET